MLNQNFDNQFDASNNHHIQSSQNIVKKNSGSRFFKKLYIKMRKFFKVKANVVFFSATLSFVAVALFLGVLFGVILQNRGTDKYVVVDLKNNTVAIQEYLGDSKNIIIPSKLSGKTVVGINDKAFSVNNNSDCASIKTIRLPSSLTFIGNSAFFGCKNLSNISIPASVKTIGDYAFQKCSNLGSAVFEAKNSDLVSVGRNVFDGTRILDYYEDNESKNEFVLNGVLLEIKNIPSDYSLDSDVRVIASGVFFQSEIQSVSIPTDSILQGISDYAFFNTFNLYSFEFQNASNLKWIGKSAFLGDNLIMNAEFDSALSYIGINAFENCTGLRSLSFCSKVDFGSYAFRSCKIESLQIDGRSSNVGNAFYSAFRSYAFGGVDIVCVGGVAAEFEDIFSLNCKNLSFNNIVELFDSDLIDAFDRLDQLQIPAFVASQFTKPLACSNVVIFGAEGESNAISSSLSSVFSSLVSLTLIDVSSICENAFLNISSLATVNFGDQGNDFGMVSVLGFRAFSGTPWISSCINSFRTYDSLFSGFSDNQLVIGGTLLDVRGNFGSSIAISSSVNRVDTGALSNLNSSTSCIYIPASVLDIGKSAFANLNNITKIGFVLNEDFESNLMYVRDFAFASSRNLAQFVSARKVGNSVVEFGDVLILSNIVDCSSSAFNDTAWRTNISSSGPVVWANSVLLSFIGNTPQTLIIQSGIRVICNSAFVSANKSGTTEIFLPDSVVFVGDLAFSNFYNVTVLTLGNSSNCELSIIQDRAFMNMSSLQQVWVYVSEDFDIDNAFVLNTQRNSFSVFCFESMLSKLEALTEASFVEFLTFEV